MAKEPVQSDPGSKGSVELGCDHLVEGQDTGEISKTQMAQGAEKPSGTALKEKLMDEKHNGEIFKIQAAQGAEKSTACGTALKGKLMNDKNNGEIFKTPAKVETQVARARREFLRNRC